MNHQEHTTETPDTSHIRNIDVTHEVSDVYLGGIARFVLALVILMLVSFIVVWAMFRTLKSRSTEPPPSPMALNEQERLPPEPRLQGAPGFAEQLDKSTQKKTEQRVLSPAISANAPAPKGRTWEILVLREQWEDVLKNGPADQNGQRYGMPIEQAKAEVLKQLAAQQQKTFGSKQEAVSSKQ